MELLLLQEKELPAKAEVVVVGSGIAGVTAAIYAKTLGVNVVLLDAGIGGGKLRMIDKISNYPGLEGTEGKRLAEMLLRRIEEKEITFSPFTPVLSIEEKVVKTTKGDIEAKAIIIASGSTRKKLGIEGEERFLGKGVSYCVYCDIEFFKGKKVAIIAEEENHETKIAEKFCNVLFFSPDEIEMISGNKKVDEIVLKNGEKKKVDGVFILTKERGNTPFIQGIKKVDGFIPTNEKMMSEKEGVFACGDVRWGNEKQLVVAAGEGAIAGINAVKYVRGEIKWSFFG